MTGLVDQYGAPLKRDGLRELLLRDDDFGAELSGVRQPTMGDPVSGLDPARLGRIMKAADQGDTEQYFELAEIIEERDAHYIGVLGTRRRQVSQIPIRVEAASDAKAHVLQADFVRSWLTRDVLQDELFHMLDAIGKGISFMEINWQSDDRQNLYPENLTWVTQRWFNFDKRDLETPLLRGRVRNAEGKDELSVQGTPLPYGKFLTTRIQSKSGLAVRSGLSRVVAWCVMWKKFTERDWALFSQTYGQPIRVGKYNPGATEKQRRDLLRAITNIAADMSAVIPSSMMVEFIEAKSQGASGANFENRVNYLDRQVSKAVLGQTATTDAIAGGHAVGKEHREVQKDIANADAKALQAVLNQQLLRVMIDVNFGPQEIYPRFVIEEPDRANIMELTTSVERMVKIGMRVSASEMRDKLGLADPSAGDEILGVREKEPVEKTEPKALGLLDGFSGQARERQSGTDLIDAIARQAGNDWEVLLSDVVDDVVTLLEASADLKAFQAGLPHLVQGLDASVLAQALGDAQVVALMVGLSD